MIDFKLLAMGAGGAVVVTALLVWPMAHHSGVEQGRKEQADELLAAKRVLTRTVSERDQCRSELASQNIAIAAQTKETLRVLLEDRQQRAEAGVRMEAVTADAVKEAKRAGDQAYAARQLIAKIKDQCTNAAADPTLVGMLNDILGASPTVGDKRLSGAGSN